MVAQGAELLVLCPCLTALLPLIKAALHHSRASSLWRRCHGGADFPSILLSPARSAGHWRELSCYTPVQLIQCVGSK